ncbi:hypothetical protein SAMN05720606_11551 [Paenibacillus polysaccharolyticus]|uniref:Uncharacterized protein n=1 Tax=Paenibacillus polysaccharolyticus TaxID=582692 RepID=A0A1G5KJ00_9BACL|nr:hypothetical protein [Paenibacillus polysaccharolyticus]SCZ00038.1 hypothetical protein SAMN05720606_11551 [Paenibacillus polysaccharolyticus]
MRSSILKSLKPDIIVDMLDMAVAFENWSKVLLNFIFVRNVHWFITWDGVI